MSRSSSTKTSSSIASDRGATVPAEALVELRDVSLRFVTYTDKQYSLKRSALDLLLRREGPPITNEFWALRDVNLSMRKGERIGVLGLNGAGKSTLLRLLARIYTPTQGNLTVKGTVAPLIEMGAGFNPELSGFDNILLNGAMLGIKPREMRKRVEGIYEFTGLREFADLPLKYYSSGMHARLAFAIATEVDPEILLIDESLGVGDVVFVDRAKERIRKLLERSNLVVIVSHDLSSLESMCLRGIWMHEGQVRADGPIDEALASYRDFTKSAAAVQIKGWPNRRELTVGMVRFEEGRDVRIGIDMLGIQSPGGIGRDSSRLGRRLVSSLLARATGHHFVLYAREDGPSDRANWSRGRTSIQDVVDRNPDGLDWLVLLDPFSIRGAGIAPRARVGGVKIASLIADLGPGRVDDRRLAPLRSHDAILAYSEEAESEALRKLSTATNRVVRLGIGVDEAWLDSDPADPGAGGLAHLGIGGSFLLANLAAGPQGSNLGGILDAYRRLPSDLRDGHQLVIAGDVDDPWASVRFLQDRGCAEGLVLVGRVDDPTLRRLYGRSAAFVSPSFAGASTLSLVEAMGRGAAIVAGWAGCQPAVLDGAGLLADPSDPSEIADQVARLLSDPGLNQTLRRNALEHSGDFPWEPVVGRFLAALEDDERRLARPRPDRIVLGPLGDAAPGSAEMIFEFDLEDPPAHRRPAGDIAEMAPSDELEFGDLAWDDVTIHVLADVFSVRPKRRLLALQPGLVLLRDETSLDRIGFRGRAISTTLADVEAEVACSRLREVFATSSRLGVRSSRTLRAIRSQFPEFADQVVLIPPSGRALDADRGQALGVEQPSASTEVGRPGDGQGRRSFPRRPGLTPLPLDV